jgi:hypothetical protein
MTQFLRGKVNVHGQKFWANNVTIFSSSWKSKNLNFNMKKSTQIYSVSYTYMRQNT